MHKIGYTTNNGQVQVCSVVTEALDRGRLVETKTKTKAKTLKILPRGCLETRQCFEAPHHCRLVR